MNIGFIGLGNMGAGMALNLLRHCQESGDTLIVFDINEAVLVDLIAKGAVNGQSVAKLCSQCEVLFTSLPSSKEVNLLAFGDDGILAMLKEGATWFETSTNELSEWQKVKNEAPIHLTLVDAPVSGGAEGALAGTLAIFLGIDEGVLNRFESLLRSFAARVERMGPSGAGYVTKLAQLHLNYLVAQGIGETLMLGAKANLDLGVLHSVLMSSCARSYVVESYIPKVLDGSYDTSFALGLAEKDMRLITELGQHLEVKMPLGDKVYSTYQAAMKAYGENAPHLSIVRLMEEQHDQILRS
ncbi:MAG TPA: NAD(P)-dependent oxidoreductase [Candidatus Thioglobus sp.]|jgi:3-hydroxyisobutyrate dehydrogenase|nr:NAD(P)-dependent oxidoreductase [Candidatus Thioglobus sp.]HIL20649.1 NAD(P)-dependent oxidoreductase [Candidatus Thioglobus sp.]